MVGLLCYPDYTFVTLLYALILEEASRAVKHAVMLIVARWVPFSNLLLPLSPKSWNGRHLVNYMSREYWMCSTRLLHFTRWNKVSGTQLVAFFLSTSAICVILHAFARCFSHFI